MPNTPEADRIDPQYRADRAADVVIDLISRLVPGPIVLVVEEAHWADGASAHLLDRVAFATDGRPWAVVAVRRGDTGGFAPESGTSVVLGPLPNEVIERLVIAATEATPLRPHEVAAVVERAEGNPLFVEEVTRLALGSGSMAQLPESVQAAMSTQIDQLPPPVRRILRYCAVLGRSFRREVLERTLTAEGVTLETTDLTALASFLEDEGDNRLQFRNSLVRDAAYEGLAYRIRARIHRAAGEVLEGISTDLDADSPTLVLHFARAGDAASDLALRTDGRRAGATLLRQRRRGRPLRDGPGDEHAGCRTSPTTTVRSCGHGSVSCASSPGCSRRRWTPTGEPHGSCATTRWPAPRCSTARRPCTPALVSCARRCASWGGPGASSTAPTGQGVAPSSASTVSPRGSASSRSAWGTRKRGRRRLRPGPARSATAAASCWP